MREGYYYVTRNSLKNFISSPDEYDPRTLSKSILIKKRYPKDTLFKVIGYYVAYDTTTIPLPGGGRVPEYLVLSIEDKEIFWIPYYIFDIDTCSINYNRTAKTFNADYYYHDINFTKEELNIDDMQITPFK